MPTLTSASDTIERTLWTAEDFLDWLEPKIYADLIDGEKFMHSPVNLRHANLINFVDRLLAGFIEERELGVLHRENVAIRLSARNVFLPDLSYFTKEQAARLGDAYIGFAPSLIVEALSPATAHNDIGPKFAAYEEHGVMEYWVLDPETQAHRFYARDGEIFVEFAHCEEIIKSRHLFGFAMKRSWLGPGELPRVSTVRTQVDSLVNSKS